MRWEWKEKKTARIWIGKLLAAKEAITKHTDKVCDIEITLKKQSTSTSPVYIYMLYNNIRYGRTIIQWNWTTCAQNSDINPNAIAIILSKLLIFYDAKARAKLKFKHTHYITHCTQHTTQPFDAPMNILKMKINEQHTVKYRDRYNHEPKFQSHCIVRFNKSDRCL